MSIEIKIALVGDNSVGKTSFVSRLATDKFQSTNDYNNFYYQVNDGIIYNFIFTKLEEASYVLLMFDLSNINSLNYVDDFLRQKINKNIILIGNKRDLIKYIPEKDYAFHQLYSNVVKYLYSDKTISKYYDVSALSFHNYTKPFDYIIEKYNSRII